MVEPVKMFSIFLGVFLLTIKPAVVIAYSCDFAGTSVNPGEVSTEYFTLEARCLSDRVEVTWKKSDKYEESFFNEFFFAKSYLLCRDTFGNEIDEILEIGDETSYRGRNGTDVFNTGSISSCVAYGCQLIKYFEDTSYYTKNSTCIFDGDNRTETDFTTSSISSYNITEGPPIGSSGSNQNKTSISNNSSTQRSSNSSTGATVQATSMQKSTAPPSGVLSTSSESRLQSTSQWAQPDGSTRRPLSASLPSSITLDFGNLNDSMTYLWIFGTIGFLLVTGSCLVGGVVVFIHCKSKQKRSKQNIFHSWNLQHFEKIDPNFIPIEVDQRLEKHESTISIIEHLNQPNKEILHPVPKHTSIVNENQQLHRNATTVSFPERYMLHTPSSMENDESPTHEYLRETTLYRTLPCHSQPHLLYNGNMNAIHQETTTVHSTYQERTMVQSAHDISPQTQNNMSTSSAANISGYYWDSISNDDQESLNNKSLDNSDSTSVRINIETTSDYKSSSTSKNRVNLRFAPSQQTNSNEVIYLDSLQASSGHFNYKQSFCEDITEQNFHIDPRHFDPL